jgi:hypothetical protein
MSSYVKSDDVSGSNYGNINFDRQGLEAPSRLVLALKLSPRLL